MKADYHDCICIGNKSTMLIDEQPVLVASPLALLV